MTHGTNYQAHLLSPSRPHPALGRDPADLRRLVERHVTLVAPRLRRLWAYYENPADAAPHDDDRHGSDRPYRQAQEWGLPSRITGTHSDTLDTRALAASPADAARKEVVIENDIRWRIDTGVDFLFGKAITVNAILGDSARGREVRALARLILAHNGGMRLLQRLALLSAVYGHVDVIVHCDPSLADPQAGGDIPAPTAGLPLLGDLGLDDAARRADLARAARCVRLEVVPPTQSLAVFDEHDPARLTALLRVRHRPAAGDEHRDAAPPRRTLVGRLLAQLGLPTPAADDRPLLVDALGTDRWQRYEGDALVEAGEHGLGRVPAVRVWHDLQHADAAGSPGGGVGGGVGGEVEPLVPLQDELNTRLSDRANRLTMQSFKMYLGRGIDNFTDLPVRPGQMWQSDDPSASVIEFGTDAPAPSEDAHIAQLRGAMDKVSGVTPVAAGVIEGRVGRLTSAVALRVTLMATLTRTERRRLTWEDGLARVVETALARLDHAGVFATTPAERGITVRWPNPLPADPAEELAVARAKLDVGVDPAVVLRELGYGAGDDT